MEDQEKSALRKSFERLHRDYGYLDERYVLLQAQHQEEKAQYALLHAEYQEEKARYALLQAEHQEEKERYALLYAEHQDGKARYDSLQAAHQHLTEQLKETERLLRKKEMQLWKQQLEYERMLQHKKQ